MSFIRNTKPRQFFLAALVLINVTLFGYLFEKDWAISALGFSILLLGSGLDQFFKFRLKRQEKKYRYLDPKAHPWVRGYKAWHPND